MKLSVVIPVKNEASAIGPLLDSLIEQTLPPDEIVVVDGGSTDGTQIIVQDYSRRQREIRLLCDANAFPGRGRNLGTASAANDWIAFTDAGVTPAKDWLAELTEPARRDPSIDVVYGRWEPITDTFFKECAAIAYAPAPPKTIDQRFIQSRAVFSSLVRRSVWQEVNGFPEELRSAEDILFMKRIEERGFRIADAPEANVYWQMQATWSDTFGRFLTYSMHTMRAGLWRHWQAKVIGGYAPLLFGALAAFLFTRWWAFIAAGLFLMMFIARGVKALWRNRDIYPASILRNSLRLLIICPLLA